MNCMKEPEILTIDAHCHLFNHEVLSWRLLADFILSRIRRRGMQDRLETAGGIGELRRIIRFFKTGLMAVEDIYGKLLAEGGCNTVVPLMFDLDYCMKGAGRSGGLRRRKGYKKNVKKAARKEWAALRKELDELAEQAGRGERRELGEMKQALRRLSRRTERLSLGNGIHSGRRRKNCSNWRRRIPAGCFRFTWWTRAAPATACTVRTGRLTFPP